MTGRPPRSPATVVKRAARRALGVVSPRLLERIQLARTQARYLAEPDQGPRRLQLEATTGCNYRCIMCTDHSSLLSDHTPARSMPFDQVERLLRESAAMGAEELWLSGRGDPLVHPQVTRIIALATSLGMVTTITTNAGLLSDALADQLCEAGLGTLSVSINSARPDTYAEIHDAEPQERARILSLMKRLSERPQRPRLMATMVLLKTNFAELLDFVRDGIEAGADALALLGLRCVPIFPALALDDDDWKRVRRDQEAAAALAEQAGVELRVDGIPSAEEESASPDRSHWSLGCFVGHVFTRVDVDGNLHGCCSCTNHLGNLKDAPFADLWRSRAYEHFRWVCRELPAARLMPVGCDCVSCGNMGDNALIHAELGFRPLHGRTSSRIATRLDLAEIVWRHLNDLLPGAGEGPEYADLTPAEAGLAWTGVVGLHSAGVMPGELTSEGPREFLPRQTAAYEDAATALRRTVTVLGIPPDRSEQMVSSAAPQLPSGEPLLKREIEAWARSVRVALAKVPRPR